MKLKLKPIYDQVVVLVGATSGAGLETAMLMAEKGARVAIVGRSMEGLNDALDQVRLHATASYMNRMQARGMDLYTAPGEDISMGYHRTEETAGSESSPAQTAHEVMSEDQVMAVEGDITNFEQMRSVADQVMQRFGRIDTWVNLAGVSEWALFEDTSPDEFHRIIEVNLVGQAYAAMAALPYLRQQRGGALIFVGSMAGRVPVPYQSAYSASKHGLLGLADTLRMEQQYTGLPVSITTILPASMNTPLFEKARTKIGVEPEPVPPIYDAKMLAKAIVYAATHPVREMIVGDAGYLINFVNRISPRLAHSVMSATGFTNQRNGPLKSGQAPDNLYEHISGYNQAEGEFYDRERRFAPLTWLSTHPAARIGLYGVLLGGLGAFLGWRIMKERAYRRTWRYRLPRQARKITREARAIAGKTLQSAGERVSEMQIASNLPMMHRRSFPRRAVDTLAGFWTAVLAILPFTQRKSLMRRITDRIPSVNMPWKQRESFVDRVTMADQRKKVGKRIEKTSDKVRETISDRRKDAAKTVEKAVQRGKEAAMKAPVIEHRESIIEKVTFRK